MYKISPSGHPPPEQVSPPPQAAAENFPVALRMLPASRRAQLFALYRYARYVDDIGDELAGDRVAALEAVAADVRGLYAGEQVTDDVVAGLRVLVAECDVPPGPLLRLVEANMQDQRVRRYETFDDLLGYCALSANPVGEVVLHIFGQATPDLVMLSDRVCTGLQLLEHWQDVAEDHGLGRVYLPQVDLRRFGVTVDDLARPQATTSTAALIGFETDRALAWLNSGAVLVSALRGWARLAVSGYLAGGRAAAQALERCGYDSLQQVPKAGSREVVTQWLRATVRSPG